MQLADCCVRGRPDGAIVPNAAGWSRQWYVATRLTAPSTYLSTSSESHPHDKCSTSRRCPHRKASKSSVGLLPDQLQVQMEASKWFPCAIFSVHSRGFRCSIKSRNLELRTLQERCTRQEGYSQHPSTTWRMYHMIK